MKRLYSILARRSSEVLGTAGAFLCAILVIMVWGMTGRWFHFSDTWQLVINTGTTIVTFLMVFLIQYAQNRDSKTTQLKLDELIKAVRSAQNEMLDLDRLSDEELERMEAKYKKISEHAIARRSKKHRAA
jgi:low affinity Fe/Cu permease